MGSIPESERSPGGGHGHPLQCSCLGNVMNRGAGWATVHRTTKSQTRLKWRGPRARTAPPGTLGADAYCLLSQGPAVLRQQDCRPILGSAPMRTGSRPSTATSQGFRVRHAEPSRLGLYQIKRRQGPELVRRLRADLGRGLLSPKTAGSPSAPRSLQPPLNPRSPLSLQTNMPHNLGLRPASVTPSEANRAGAQPSTGNSEGPSRLSSPPGTHCSPVSFPPSASSGETEQEPPPGPAQLPALGALLQLRMQDLKLPDLGQIPFGHPVTWVTLG